MAGYYLPHPPDWDRVKVSENLSKPALPLITPLHLVKPLLPRNYFNDLIYHRIIHLDQIDISNEDFLGSES